MDGCITYGWIACWKSRNKATRARMGVHEHAQHACKRVVHMFNWIRFQNRGGEAGASSKVYIYESDPETDQISVISHETDQTSVCILKLTKPQFASWNWPNFSLRLETDQTSVHILKLTKHRFWSVFIQFALVSLRNGPNWHCECILVSFRMMSKLIFWSVSG